MTQYCYNKKADDNGVHEVHRTDCKYLPLPENREYTQSSSDEVVLIKLRMDHPELLFDGCGHCMKPFSKF